MREEAAELWQTMVAEGGTEQERGGGGGGGGRGGKEGCVWGERVRGWGLRGVIRWRSKGGCGEEGGGVVCQ